MSLSVKTESKRTGKPTYRITYGETAPVWTDTRDGWLETKKFVEQHLGFGDIIFKIERV